MCLFKINVRRENRASRSRLGLRDGGLHRTLFGINVTEYLFKTRVWRKCVLVWNGVNICGDGLSNVSRKGYFLL